MCWLSWNMGTSTFWNPQGLFRPVMGLLYLASDLILDKLCVFFLVLMVNLLFTAFLFFCLFVYSLFWGIFGLFCWGYLGYFLLGICGLFFVADMWVIFCWGYVGYFFIQIVIPWHSHTLYVLRLYKLSWPDDGSVEPKHVAACTLTKYTCMYYLYPPECIYSLESITFNLPELNIYPFLSTPSPESRLPRVTVTAYGTFRVTRNKCVDPNREVRFSYTVITLRIALLVKWLHSLYQQPVTKNV
jgi:hypothetical protein